MIGNVFRGFHPRLFMLFASGEPTDRRQRGFPSAKRMNVNSRGCEPTDQRPETYSTLKGSYNALFGPFRAGLFVYRCSVGFTHGYACYSPPANRQLHAAIRCWMLDVGRWMFPPSHV